MLPPVPLLPITASGGVPQVLQLLSRRRDGGWSRFSGFQLLGLNRDSNAIQLFLSNVQRHPASARAYDSLAQAYVKSGNERKPKSTSLKRYGSTRVLNMRVRGALNQLG